MLENPSKFGNDIPVVYELGLVSIIVPTYNRATLLLETLSSIAGQTYRPLEVVVIDDGSSDDTAEQVQKWQKTSAAGSDLIVHYVKQENSGAPAARNHGLMVSKGEYIQYLDSDDTLSSKKIEMQVQALFEDVTCDVVHGDSYDMESLDRAEPLLPLTNETGLLKCITSWTLPTNNPLFRRNACIQIGFWDERMKCYEDASYMAGIFCKGLKLGYVAGADSYIRGHHNSSCNNYGPRVSFRGEASRAYDNVLALYRHHVYIWREFPNEFLVCSNYRAAITKECFRVARQLLQVGETDRADKLLRRHAEVGDSLRETTDRTTLDVARKLFGHKHGAQLHEKIHDSLYGLKRFIR